ncbi:hypothetical protein QR680_013202 [Steinernema hermaphroditum]|uniref:N-acetyltransferase domain-containing protein n=1 Tax=Steinernema hermaphroditum TaxID=289476 RepID=A0AA39I4P4_9BILA|nr:hypothetical protein QR680_013202 [Steinernema hermaphroditum]
MALSNFDFVRATLRHFDITLEFMKTVYVTHSPLYRAMEFDADDVDVFMRPVVEKCLARELSVLVFERTSGDLIGLRLLSFWRRPRQFGPPPTLHLPLKLVAFVEMMDAFKNSFWSLCPPEVDTVLRREFSCVRRDFQRRGIGTHMADLFLDRGDLKAMGVGGVMSETSSIANQSLLAKKGFRPLRELAYAECLDTNGNRVVPNDFHDGSPKIVLNFQAI